AVLAQQPPERRTTVVPVRIQALQPAPLVLTTFPRLSLASDGEEPRRVPLGDRVLLTALDQALDAVLAHRFEQPVPGRAGGGGELEKRVLDQAEGKAIDVLRPQLGI